MRDVRTRVEGHERWEDHDIERAAAKARDKEAACGTRDFENGPSRFGLTHRTLARRTLPLSFVHSLRR